MELHFIRLVMYAVSFTFLIFLFYWYWNFKKKTWNFPFCNLFSYLLYCKISGRISKDAPFNNVIFEKLVELGKLHFKEGHFMIYCLQPTLFIYSEEAIKIFGKEKAALDKSPEYKLLEDVMKAGIATSNGERWKKHRKLINPAFHMSMLKEKVELFNAHAMNLVTDMEKLIGKPTTGITDILKFHFVNALCESILGLKQDEEHKAKILKFCKSIDQMCAMTVKKGFMPWLRLKFLTNFFPFGKKFLQLDKECDDFVDETISIMKSCVFSKNNIDSEHFGSHFKKSIAYTLLNQHLNDPTFTLEDIRCEVRTIFATGYDSTTISTMWCLYMLGLHPEIQERIHNEIQVTTSDYVTYEETNNLTYLEAVIMETLRLFPTVPILIRNLTDDVQYGKFKVFKGTSIAFFPFRSHRNPTLFPDPEKFNPERFINKEVKNPCSFMPFSEGSRSCIGKNYALIEMKIFLSHIIRNFKITSLDRREDVKLCWTIGLFPVKRLRFKIEYRQNTS